MDERDWQSVTRLFAQECTKAGLDLVHPFGVGHYHATGGAPLPDFGRSNALGILVGNTRALWPAFTHAFAGDEALAAEPNPLDAYVTAHLERAIRLATSARHSIVLAHSTVPRPFPIQRLAEHAGLAGLAPCHLAIHPEFGLWWALRAAVVVDRDGPAELPQPAARPCDGCSAPCVTALEQALAVTPAPLGRSSIRAHADAWIRVRTICPVAPAARYGDAQLRYHYLHDRSLIRPDEPQGS
jgi:methylmalonic aciduria homocystinuria type C protein